MSDQVNTVKVKSGDSFAVINECDFDKDLHELYSDEPKPEPKAKKKAAE